MWHRLDTGLVSTKCKVKCRCQCGRETDVRVREVLAGKSRSCRACSTQMRMMAIPKEERVRVAQCASAAAAVALRAKENPLATEFGAEEVRRISRVLAGARQRCSNPANNAYVDYGLRGILFAFPSVRTGTEWVLHNIGVRPSEAYSLDRIDNNRHYEPGTLRWATRSEQARNKRVYRRTRTGERIRGLMADRPDLTYETIRLWIKQGRTDTEIVAGEKYARPGL
jgi:hypothetical protein